MQFPIDIRILKAAYLCTSHESVRYYLNGVCVQWDGAHLTAVATDGHRLIAFNLPYDKETFADADKFSVIIPNDIIKNWKVNNKLPTTILFDYVKGAPSDHCSMTADGTSVTFAPVDGVFPDWRRILPAEVSGEVAQFNTGYLDDFTRATKILYGKERFITVRHNGGSPAVINMMAPEDEFEVMAVLMPRRDTEQGSYEKPAFCK